MVSRCRCRMMVPTNRGINSLISIRFQGVWILISEGFRKMQKTDLISFNNNMEIIFSHCYKSDITYLHSTLQAAIKFVLFSLATKLLTAASNVRTLLQVNMYGVVCSSAIQHRFLNQHLIIWLSVQLKHSPQLFNNKISGWFHWMQIVPNGGIYFGNDVRRRITNTST